MTKKARAKQEDDKEEENEKNAKCEKKIWERGAAEGKEVEKEG